jgi:DNA-binding LacI/PurR family transcriptional regulator
VLTRPPSMYDVAAMAGVSHQTVSRVLNASPTVREETRERVVEAIAALGYRRNNAARVLATNKSGRLGMIATHLPLYGPNMIADAVQDAALKSGYEVALIGLDGFAAESLHAAVDRLLDQAVEAIVVAVTHGEARAAVTQWDLPVVGYDDVPDAEYFWPSLSTVRQDFDELGRRAVDLLVRALDGEARPCVDLLTPALVVRSSSRGRETPTHVP